MLNEGLLYIILLTINTFINAYYINKGADHFLLRRPFNIQCPFTIYPLPFTLTCWGHGIPQQNAVRAAQLSDALKLKHNADNVELKLELFYFT